MPVAPSDLPIPHFWEPNYWEPSVQIALRDCCRPGNVVFDVGANAGALTVLMSRLVGPKGAVFAFEASQRILERTHANLVAAGCHNEQLLHRAVYSKSHEMLPVFHGTNLNDSIYEQPWCKGRSQTLVETLALDDFVKEIGLQPDLIKMDIEGAEYDALLGCSQLIDTHKPIFILEQTPKDTRCHDLLTTAGYVAVDLANYRRITKPEDFDAGVCIANVLFIHPRRNPEHIYLQPIAPVLGAILAPRDFRFEPSGNIALKTPLKLPPGRYVCTALFAAHRQDNEIFYSINANGVDIARYHSYTQMIAENYRSLAFNLSHPTAISPMIRFLAGKDKSLHWDGAHFWHYPAFDAMPQRTLN